jgi:hypothetical protein
LKYRETFQDLKPSNYAKSIGNHYRFYELCKNKENFKPTVDEIKTAGVLLPMPVGWKLTYIAHDVYLNVIRYVYVAGDNSEYVVFSSNLGIANFDDVLSDANLIPADIKSLTELDNLTILHFGPDTKVHSGFVNDYNISDTTTIVYKSEIEYEIENSTVINYGHSLGAPRALFESLRLVRLQEWALPTTRIISILFACPRIGNDKFVDGVQRLETNSKVSFEVLNYINSYDLVHEMPVSPDYSPLNRPLVSIGDKRHAGLLPDRLAFQLNGSIETYRLFVDEVIDIFG